MTEEELAEMLAIVALGRRLDKEREGFNPVYTMIGVKTLDEILRRAEAGEKLPKPQGRV